MKFQLFFKKQMDFWISLISSIILSPLFLIIAILIKLDSNGPVFFRQERVGREGRVFKIWKFRTMVEKAQEKGLGFKIAENDLRITRIGRFLRRFGIDELPQLMNVISGEMSLVGPRASLPHQAAQYTEFEKRRFEVRPGITNINMIKGWNILPWKKRIEWDVWYINHWSLWLDLKILIKTPIIVLSGRGQYGKNGIVEDYK
ncbi:MAG: sugar transferase [bacterium]